MAVESNPLDFAKNFALGFANQRPVFYNGQKIGYWNSKEALCAKNIVLLPGAPSNTDPNKWTTKSDWWTDTPVTSYCVSKAIRPAWITPEQQTQYQVSPPVVLTPDKNMLTYLALGGAGAAILILALRR